MSCNFSGRSDSGDIAVIHFSCGIDAVFASTKSDAFPGVALTCYAVIPKSKTDYIAP